MENAGVTAIHIVNSEHCGIHVIIDIVTWHFTVKNTVYEVAPSLLFLMKY